MVWQALQFAPGKATTLLGAPTEYQISTLDRMLQHTGDLAWRLVLAGIWDAINGPQLEARIGCLENFAASCGKSDLFGPDLPFMSRPF